MFFQSVTQPCWERGILSAYYIRFESLIIQLSVVLQTLSQQSYQGSKLSSFQC